MLSNGFAPTQLRFVSVLSLVVSGRVFSHSCSHMPRKSHLRGIRAVRRQLGHDVTAKLVTALVLSRLDYCNAVLAGLPASTLAPFQRVLHAVARTILDLKPRDRVTPALQELHWLQVVLAGSHNFCPTMPLHVFMWAWLTIGTTP